MNEHDATELAYKKGAKDFAERMRNWVWLFGGEYAFRERDIDLLLKEMGGEE